MRRDRLYGCSQTAPLVVAVAALAASRPARALDIPARSEVLRLDITESMFLAAHLDNGTVDPTNKNYGELLNRLNAQLAWRRWLFAVRFDSAAYVHTPQTGDVSPHASCNPGPGAPALTPTLQKLCVVQPGDTRLRDRFLPPGGAADRGGVPLGVHAFYLEKISLTYTGRSVDAVLGDFYANLGRGLVLSIRKVDELGIDTTATGAKVLVHEGNFNAVALAGWTNSQNIDQAQALWAADPNDLIAAASVGYRFFDRINLAAHGAFGLPSKDTANPPCGGKDCERKPFDYVLRPGLLLDAPRLLRWLGLYAEYAWELDRIGASDRRGSAFYGAATATTTRTSWLLEVKDYRHYLPWRGSVDPFGNAVYTQPPTLELVTTPITDNTNITAGRVRFEVRASPSLLLYASGELGRSEPTEATRFTVLDLYYGAQASWGDGRSHFYPVVGYRHERDDIKQAIHDRLISIRWDFVQYFAHGMSLETNGLIWDRQKGEEVLPGDNHWQEGNAYLAVRWAPRLIATFGYEFTTIAKEAKNTHHFFNGTLLWNITPGTSIALFAGGNRPGLKCISGVCRDFPAFQGVRLELVLRL